MLNVAIEFKRADFLLHINFISHAAVTGLYGASGAGKSTLLHLIAGLLTPHQGHIVLNEHLVYCSKKKINLPTAQRRVGLVFQDSLLFPHLSVRHNLLYGYYLLAAEQRRFLLNDIAQLLEIQPLLNKKPQQLSGGEKQRVALGRALLASPQVLLLDEPLAALDTRLKAQILPFLLRARDELHLPMLYVSHSMPELEYLAAHIIHLPTEPRE